MNIHRINHIVLNYKIIFKQMGKNQFNQFLHLCVYNRNYKRVWWWSTCRWWTDSWTGYRWAERNNSPASLRLQRVYPALVSWCQSCDIQCRWSPGHLSWWRLYEEAVGREACCEKSHQTYFPAGWGSSDPRSGIPGWAGSSWKNQSELSLPLFLWQPLIKTS